MTMASRIAVMSRAACCRSARPQEIYSSVQPLRRRLHRQRQPVRRQAQRRQGRPLRITTAARRITGRHGITVTLGMPVTLAVRPRRSASPKQRPAGVDCNLFLGRVKEIAYFGSYNTFIVVTPDGTRSA